MCLCMCVCACICYNCPAPAPSPYIIQLKTFRLLSICLLLSAGCRDELLVLLLLLLLLEEIGPACYWVFIFGGFITGHMGRIFNFDFLPLTLS